MGGAILHGVIKGGVEPAGIVIYDVHEETLKRRSHTYNVRAAKTQAEAVRGADVVVMAVKPYQIVETLREVGGAGRPIFVSVAAGVSLQTMEQELGDGAKVVRVMPNTPATVGEAMTAVCRGKNVSDRELESVCGIFELFGKSAVVGEGLINVSAGIGGCAPAYVYMFIEALADAGVLHGLARADAYTFAAQSVMGAAKMVLETGAHPGELKDAVCSAGGATIEAVAALERNAFRGIVTDAVTAAVDKMHRMGNTTKV